MSVRITDVELIPLQVPFSPRHATHMQRLGGDWSLIEVWRVTTDSGHVGYGETIAEYTWGRSAAEVGGGAPGMQPVRLAVGPVAWRRSPDGALGRGR